ncbi:hypothetical protein ACMU_15225 [Actibacterium mucosum KCTC 23349]|uniref:DUF2219 domain-containing protein n=1 Tax=Actibacterium mucosum KCTC 23349 TaxID=1454373 RepID=A0A037ZF50_9RHOB|nr:lipid A-modifier LpxR family protein [Actibacterium mucosum]KAJ55105.1 hypothetical protein ACMU_15225 [Actibacterium mucosum KCTC 23349]
MNWALKLAVALAILPGAVAAEDRTHLGVGRIFNNDFLGDGHDRWRTGSYTLSVVRGPEWTGSLPDGAGELLEYRLRSEIIAPASLTAPAAGDRRYAGILSFGLHTHFERGLLEYSVGGDMVAVGPQTGMDDLQRAAHEALDQPLPTNAAANQLGNAIYPTLVGQATMPLPISDRLESRPFIEAQVGVENFVRLGHDFVIGDLGRDDVWVRDAVTGQLYPATHTAGPGYSVVLGGDIAMVTDSRLLRESDGFSLTNARTRLRAGVNWQGEKVGVFYGLTWLGKEFKGQDDSQVVGSLNLRLKF